MSTPLATNREPAYGAGAGVLAPFRFSARGDGGVLDRSKLSFHIGAGPVFWKGSILPEDSTDLTFILKTLSGVHPHAPATRTIEMDGSLKLEKLTAYQDQEALYECGGLEAPADPYAPLMLEFTLSLAQADVTMDVNGFTGVLVGLKNNNTGVAIKFFSNGVARRIELHDAQYSTSSALGPQYIAAYDWDQSQPHTYKLLWYPSLNVVRLYLSQGQGVDTPDTLLIDGAVSDFLGPLPTLERPANQPVAYFGHGYPTTTSTSYWHEFYLHNKVSSPVILGLYQGKHTGLIQTDEVVLYSPVALPRNYEKPWLILPASFGPIGGVEELTTQRELWITRGDTAKSFGFFRKEPELKYSASMFDFRVSGELLHRLPGLGAATGMEVYVDDGTKHVRFALLDDEGVQSVGVLSGLLPSDILSYTIQEGNWVNPYDYRILLDPVQGAMLFRMEPSEEGVDEILICTKPYLVLPATAFPGPGFGFLHNANTIAAHARMKIGRLRYSTGLRYLFGGIPISPWSMNAANGSVSSSSYQWIYADAAARVGAVGFLSEDVGKYAQQLDDGSAWELLSVTPTWAAVESKAVGGKLTINHTNAVGPYYFYRNEPTLDSENGFMAEFRAKVLGYTIGLEQDPIRTVPGVGVSIDDGSYQYALMFAEMGPPTGKIMFLATVSDLEQNLFDIRAGSPAVAGSYAAVDWSIFHIYRIEKTVGGRLRIYVDDSEDPAIDFETSEFSPIPTAGVSQVRFGSLLSGRTTESQWQFLRHSVSSGLDVSALPVLSDTQLRQRFKNGLNTIAEVWIV